MALSPVRTSFRLQHLEQPSRRDNVRLTFPSDHHRYDAVTVRDGLRCLETIESTRSAWDPVPPRPPPVFANPRHLVPPLPLATDSLARSGDARLLRLSVPHFADHSCQALDTLTAVQHHLQTWALNALQDRYTTYGGGL